MKKIEVSVIIPVRSITAYVRETVAMLKEQTVKSFEIIIITDKKEKLNGARVVASGLPTPAYKRNLGAELAKGSILAFLDDDSYPDEQWLGNALKVFKNGDDNLAAVGGPAITPPKDDIFQKASGWVWSSFLGSGGAGIYRCRIMPRREVDDYPSVNFLVKKEKFIKVGGFDEKHWPGEDTKLCLELIRRGGKIIYDPSVLVYHHRRKIFIPHLTQINRYAKRRGYFARKYPQTSFKPGYLLPSIFVYFLLFGSVVSLFSIVVSRLFLCVVLAYLIALLLTGIQIYREEKNIFLTLLVLLAIYFTHFSYGLLFPIGFFNREIKTTPHSINIKTGSYIGG